MSNIVWQICRRELLRNLMDRRICMLLVGGPFLYAILFGGVYWQGRAKFVPVVIVDQDHSVLSRQVVTALRSSDSLDVVGYIDSVDDFPVLLRREQAYACVVIPLNFERDLYARRGPRMLSIADGSNILISGVASSAIRNVAATFQAQVDRQQIAASGVSPQASLVLSRPIESISRQLFNPTANYSVFMLMCLVCLAIQSVSRMALGVSLGLDDFETLRDQVRCKSFKMAHIFIGKTLAATAILLPVSYVAISLPFLLFGAPMHGNLLLIMLAITMFVLVHIGMAFGYLGVLKTPLRSLHFHMFMAVLMSMISGVTWPALAMPWSLRLIATHTPIYQMICIVRRVSLIGAPAYDLLLPLSILALWFLLAIVWGYWGVRRHMLAQKDNEPTS